MGERERDCECHNNHFIKLKSNYLNDNLYLKRENGSTAAAAEKKQFHRFITEIK